MMQGKWEDGTLTIILPERIDASNAAAAEAEIEQILAEGTAEKIVLDAGTLEYISSAGLRIIIKLVKREKNVTVVNVSPVVYEIFEVSGFTNFISVEKA
ncbi:MAG: STAS domain-containing protein [Solobacterium sp.]|nr:STAS domain-containing protein [Solobacterium sp.]